MYTVIYIVSYMLYTHQFFNPVFFSWNTALPELSNISVLSFRFKLSKAQAWQIIRSSNLQSLNHRPPQRPRAVDANGWVLVRPWRSPRATRSPETSWGNSKFQPDPAAVAVCTVLDEFCNRINLTSHHRVTTKDTFASYIALYYTYTYIVIILLLEVMKRHSY